MMKARFMVGVCVLLALPSGLHAQRRSRAADAGSKDAAKMAARPRGGMARQRAAIGRLQQSVETAANRVAQRSQSGNASVPWIEGQALQIQSNLHLLLKRLDQADATATPSEKRHVATLRSHDEAALAAADQLVAEAHKPKPDRSTMYTRAHAIFEQIREAGRVSATDDWSS